MNLNDVVNYTGSRTTDTSGHMANFVFKGPDLIGHLEARLDTSAGASPALWKILWTAHWRTDQGQVGRDRSADPHALMARFTDLRFEATPARSLDELTG